MNRQSVHYKSLKIMNVLAILTERVIKTDNTFEL